MYVCIICICMYTYMYMYVYVHVYIYIFMHEMMACQGVWANYIALESFMGTTKSINICEHL